MAAEVGTVVGPGLEAVGGVGAVVGAVTGAAVGFGATALVGGGAGAEVAVGCAAGEHAAPTATNASTEPKSADSVYVFVIAKTLPPALRLDVGLLVNG